MKRRQETGIPDLRTGEGVLNPGLRIETRASPGQRTPGYL